MTDANPWGHNPLDVDMVPSPVHIVGLGTTGVPCAVLLAQAGVRHFHFWDNDVVGHENLAHQPYNSGDVGKKKVDVVCERLTGLYAEALVTCHHRRVDEYDLLGGLAISMVDSIEERRIIWDAIKRHGRTSFYIDGRLGPDGGKVFALSPSCADHVEQYERHLERDGNGLPVCGKSRLAATIAAAVAHEAVMRVARYTHKIEGCPDPYDNFVAFSHIPERQLVLERWSQEW